MSLIVKRAGADEYGRFMKVLLAGPSGSGKTRLSSTFPDPIYASADPGLMSVVDRQVRYVEINSSDDLNVLRMALTRPEDKQKEILGFVPRTVVLDTVDDIQRMLVRERLAETKQDALKIQDFGWLGDQMRNLVRNFRNLPLHVVLCVHVKDDKDDETGRTSVKAQMQGQVADELPQMVDLAVLLRTQFTTRIVDGVSKRVSVRLMQTAGDISYPWVKDRSGKLPTPDMEINLEDDFAQLNKLIFGDLESLPPTRIEAEVASMRKEPDTTAYAEKRDEARTVQQRRSRPSSPPVSPPAEAAPAETVAISAPKSAAEIVASAATEPGVIRCENPDCPFGGVVEGVDQADLSRTRFRTVLCRQCFKAKPKAS